jgi:type VI secretion system Hcp family effector
LTFTAAVTVAAPARSPLAPARQPFAPADFPRLLVAHVGKHQEKVSIEVRQPKPAGFPLKCHHQLRKNDMRSLILWISTALIGLTTPVAHAAEVFLMQVPGVGGDTTLAGYRGWISVGTFAAGFSNAAADTSGAVTTGARSCQSLQVIKPLDATSPQMSMAVFSGTAYPTVTLVALKPSGTSLVPFLRFTLSDVVVNSIAFVGNDSTSAQNESLTLVYGQIQVTYLVQDPTGAITAVSTTMNCLTGTAN